MTPLDQTLVDQMKSALSKSAPDVTQAINNDATHLGGVLVAEKWGERIRITNTSICMSVYIDKGQLIRLEAWLEQIGWRCS